MVTPSSRAFKAIFAWLALWGVLASCGRGGPRAAKNTPTVPVATPVATTTLYQKGATYPVAKFEGYVVQDAQRQREIPIAMRYPQNAPGPLPVIIFSHGGGDNPNLTATANAFFDAYVLGDPAAKAWLRTNPLSSVSGGEVTLTAK